MGYEVEENAVIQGYAGNRAVEMMVRMPTGYSIGFARSPEGYYEIVADWWGVRGTDSNVFSSRLEHEFEVVEKRIRQKYAVNKVMSQLKKQGFKVVEQAREIDGTVKILARRW